MPLQVAMPIIKRPDNGDYDGFYDQAGNPVLSFVPNRHPRLAAGQPLRSEKLELAIQVIEDHPWPKNIYAMFPGLLKHHTVIDGNGNSRSALELRFDFKIPDTKLKSPSVARALGNLADYDTRSWLYRLNPSCLQLESITYTGVQSDKIVEALRDIIDRHWDDYSGFLARFPVPLVITETVDNPDDPRRSSTIRHQITRLVKQGQTEEALQVLSRFIEAFISDLTFPNPNQSVESFELPIEAGRWIGSAEDNIEIGFQYSDPISRDPIYLNPLYFFRLLFKWRGFETDVERREGGRWVRTREPLIQFMDAQQYGIENLLANPNTASVHPLLWLLKNPADPADNTADYLQYLDEPIDRMVANTNPPVFIEPLWRLFVPPAADVGLNPDLPGVADLASYARTEADGTPAIPEGGTHEWRLDDFGYIVFRKKEKRDGNGNIVAAREYPWDEEAYFTFDDRSYEKAVDIWDANGVTINNYTDCMPIPVESLLAHIARESQASPTVVALEASPRAYGFAEGDNPAVVFPSHTKYAQMTYLRITIDGRDVTFQLRNQEPRTKHLEGADQAQVAEELRAFITEKFRKKVNRNRDDAVESFDAFTARVYSLITAGQNATLWLSMNHITRHSDRVPFDQADWRDLQIANTGLNYTWRELLADVADEAIARRVSPGLVQTILTNANFRLPTLRGCALPGLPVNRDWPAIFEWLLHPENAIAAGVALFYDIRAQAGYDPVKQRCNCAGNLLPQANTMWGYVYSHTTVTGAVFSNARTNQPFVRYFNAFTAYFNRHIDDAGFDQPAIRLVRQR